MVIHRNINERTLGNSHHINSHRIQGIHVQYTGYDLPLDGDVLSFNSDSNELQWSSNISGNLTGNTYTESLLPFNNCQYDLGTQSLRFRDIHLCRGLILGDSHTISDPDRHLVTGRSHTLSGPSPVNVALLAGYNNSITGDSDHSVVLGGFTNSILANTNSHVLTGGFTNTIDTSTGSGCAMVGCFNGNLLGDTISSGIYSHGQGYINCDGDENVILGGVSGNISGETEHSVIIGGSGNKIDGSSDSLIVGGNQSNIIGNISSIVLLSCDGSTVSGGKAVIGGTNITVANTATDSVILKTNTISRTFSTANTLELDSATTNFYGDVKPDTDNSHSCGDGSHRWSDVYAVDFFGDVTGDLAGNITSTSYTQSLYSTTDATYDIGSSTQRYRDIYSSRGIVVGDSHTITDPASDTFFFVTGGGNTLNGGGATRAVIIGGNGNSITSPADNCGIVGGVNNVIVGNCNNASLLGSHTGNIYSTGSRCTIVGGQNHFIGGATDQSIVVGGKGHIIDTDATADNNCIIGGLNGNIWGSSGSSIIVSGKNHVISNGVSSACLGGENNTISAGDNNVIIGGENATISSASNQVFIQCSETAEDIGTGGRFVVKCSGHSRFDCDIRPHINNTYDLGSSSFRWDTIYSNNALNTSDERLKTDIDDLKVGLNEVLKLRPVSFRWKTGHKSKKKKHGLIAQEVERVIPELVSKPSDYFKSYMDNDGNPLVGEALREEKKEMEDDYRGINYGSMVCMLINAVKELNEKISFLSKERSVPEHLVK